MPPKDDLRLDDVKGSSPVRPDAAEQIPEGAVTPEQTRTVGVALKDLDLKP